MMRRYGSGADDGPVYGPEYRPEELNPEYGPVYRPDLLMPKWVLPVVIGGTAFVLLGGLGILFGGKKRRR